jgi:hypothetical protein
MTSLEVLIKRAIKGKGITKSVLVQRLGYGNINKGLRRLDKFLATGESDIHGLIPDLQKVLAIPSDWFQKAVEDTQEKIGLRVEEERQKQEKWEREHFEPFVEIVMDQTPRPIFLAVLAPKLWKIKVPASLQKFRLKDEFEAVFKIYEVHYKKYGGSFAHHSSARFIGFRYHRTFDEVIVFDNNGSVLERFEHHVPVNRGDLKLQNGRSVTGIMGESVQCW